MIALAAAVSIVPVVLVPTGFTEPVGADADDPAVWRDARRPELSQILGTDKAGSGAGAIYVFGLDGRVIQRLGGLDRPNNVDVEYGLRSSVGPMDVAVATERERSRLVVFAVDRATRRWRDVTGATEVFRGDAPGDRHPMGIGLLRRRDGRIFAFVSRKAGPKEGYLEVDELVANASGTVDLRFVRRFGAYSGTKEIESVVVDDRAGDVYYSDERFGVRRYAAEPLTRPGAGFPAQAEIFETTDFVGDHEGLAVGGDLLVRSDQIEGDTVYRLLPRRGPRRGARAAIAAFRGGVDATDGLEVCDLPLGPRYPGGVMVAMDSGPRRFTIWDWRKVAALARR